MVINVVTEIRSTGVDKLFSYKVPTYLENKIKVGVRVTINFNNQILEAFVVGFNYEKVDYELKDIIDVVDDNPVLNDELLKLGDYISRKYLCTKTSAYQAMLPKALKAKNGIIINKKVTTYIKLNDNDYIPTSSKQALIIDNLKNNNYILKSDLNKISTSSVKTLLSKNIIAEVKEEVYREIDISEKKDINYELTNEQSNVVNSIKEKINEFNPFLLHGVTGSGKTLVYMTLINEVIKNNKEAIVLVPEISLTPQLVSIFKARFGSIVAILHSGLSDGEKFDEWRKIVNKEVKIVIGARSAVFAPLTNIGIIIVDEEHSQTYKQDSIPFYNAIDIALYRGKKYNCPVLLGSATPSNESYTRSKVGVYTLLEMKNRVNNKMPKVHLVDMKMEIRNGRRIISKLLADKIRDRLNKDEQVMILLNRRGYSTILSCSDCGEVDKCPNCDIPLIYHKKINSLKCHYCNYYKPVTIKCSKCGSEDITYKGLGTEKLSEELEKMFDTKVIRMDVDTTKRKGAHQKILNSFESGEYSILVGTQMIAKGLDFSNVTLVGVINADSSLNIPDFRSSERTYELLSQVAGRSGRGDKDGEVVMQGFNMDHYSIVLASKHEYKAFYNEEIRVRKLLAYPPYTNLCLIKISSRDYELLKDESNKISNYLKRELKDKIILGPSNASMPKINNTYYMQVIIKYKNLKSIYKELEFIYNKYKVNRNIKVLIDINPNKI